MRVKAHYVQVPAGVGALGVELRVLRGVVRVAILPAHGLYPNYYNFRYPGTSRPYPPGTYHVALPNPEPGVWTISVTNDSLWNPLSGAFTSADEAEYAATVRLLHADLRATAAGPRRVAIDIENRGAALRDPEIQVSAGTLRTYRGAFAPTGLPSTFDIDVPSGASRLILKVRHATPGGKIEMYLYDCSSGECFSDGFTLPASGAHTLMVSRPHAGRWVVAVNAAPFPAGPGGFVLDQIITTGETSRLVSGARLRGTGERWREVIDVPEPRAAEPDATPVALVELIDVAREHDEQAHPWDPRPFAPKLRERPVAAGTLVYRPE